MTIDRLADGVRDVRGRVAGERAALVALSGIDGCGKGYVTRKLASALTARRLRPAIVNIDGWLNLPSMRFCDADPAGNFYRQAIRFDALFSQLVEPLRARRSLRLAYDHTDETATAYRHETICFDEIDVILLEGVYLLKQELRSRYDLAVWIDCSFETALERAIARSQEGLSAEETVAAYRRIYFPAQELHFERDAPKEKADLVYPNDPRISSPVENHG